MQNYLYKFKILIQKFIIVLKNSCNLSLLYCLYKINKLLVEFKKYLPTNILDKSSCDDFVQLCLNELQGYKNNLDVFFKKVIILPINHLVLLHSADQSFMLNAIFLILRPKRRNLFLIIY